MRRLYNAALLPLRAAAFAYGRWPRSTPDRQLERDQRLGRRLPHLPPGAIWIHGASVGEAQLAAALARELRPSLPGRPLALSAVTPTGRTLLPDPPVADASFFFPLDFPRVQRRAFDAIAPALLVLIETELWPNALAEAQARGVPVVVVNARLAPERLSRYRRLAGLYGPMLRSLAGVGAADNVEADRFTALGVPPSAVCVTGNLKFELAAPVPEAAVLRERFGVPPGRSIVAAGSTGAGEDRLVLDAYQEARTACPGLGLILAPRHPDRFESAARDTAARGLRMARVGRRERLDGADVLIVDSIGELAALYQLAQAAFVGGTLVRVGGHNLLEPLAAGVPVLFGPHTDHVAEMADAVLRSGAGERVADAAGLARAWIGLVSDGTERRRRVEGGRQLLHAHRGAMARTVALVRGVLTTSPRAERR